MKSDRLKRSGFEFLSEVKDLIKDINGDQIDEYEVGIKPNFANERVRVTINDRYSLYITLYDNER